MKITSPSPPPPLVLLFSYASDWDVATSCRLQMTRSKKLKPITCKYKLYILRFVAIYKCMWHIQCAVHVQWCVAFSVNTHGLEGRLQTKTISEHFSSTADKQRTNEPTLHSTPLHSAHTHTHTIQTWHMPSYWYECMNFERDWQRHYR